MSLFWQLAAAIEAAARIYNDPETQAVVQKIREWVKSLPWLERSAVLSQFESHGGYGCANCDNPSDCPEPPEDCKQVFAAMLEAAKAA